MAECDKITYIKYAKDLKRDLLRDDVKFLKVYGDDDTCVEYKRVIHGHWELLTWAFDYYRCSECGFEQRLEEFLYCPNCGADMCPE